MSSKADTLSSLAADADADADADTDTDTDAEVDEQSIGGPNVENENS